VAALNEAAALRFTLLSAPAGYGKSTLLSDWAAQTRRAVAWLSLDEADNDPERFLHYLTAALQRSSEALAAMDHDQQAVITRVLNELASHDEEITLVLDDYHLITNPAVHAIVEFVLEHAPAHFHLLISSRSDPPLALARRRARGELTELRTAELRFNEAETADFLDSVMAIKLAAADVQALTERTEGWIAGVQLAALSLRGRANVSAYIEQFTGTDRYVLDYLTEEVLIKQPTAVQNFLLLSSVLSRLAGPLCDAVTGLSGSQARLEALERDNLFITALDTQRQWYRYHPFFADLLRQRLNQADSSLPPTLHLRASHWFESNGPPVLAFYHALQAGAVARAAALFDTHPRQEAIRRVLNGLVGAPAAPALATETLLARLLAGDSPLVIPSQLLSAFEQRYPVVPQTELLSPLSERELEVLRLIAAGLSNKAIAKRLAISLNTVKTHSKSINSKLAAKSRLQATVKAQALGLI
jgi:LuxR family maltose regulon positive regulatory protein